MIRFLEPDELVFDPSVRLLCLRPYPGHPKGCLNYNKKEGCPPQASKLDQIIDPRYPLALIFNKFDFKAHKDRMRERHPEWSQRQLECCRYWQGTARKQLKAEIGLFNSHVVGPPYQVLTCPEANGLNVTETMKNIRVELEWPPINYTHQVALALVIKETQQNEEK